MFLALLVVAHHPLSVPVIGHYAVHGFFILSGYLMTLIMNRTYGYSIRGFCSYSVNRILRLYPASIVVLLFTALMIWHWNEALTSSYRQSMFMPRSVADWAQNISMAYVNLFPANVLPRLAPPTWTLTVELLFYVLIGLGLSRSRASSILWLGLSVCYMLTTNWLRLGYEYRYGMLLAGSLPFALGSTIYHYRTWLCGVFSPFSMPFLMPGLLVTLVLNGLFSAGIGIGEGLCFQASYYFNYLINAALIVALINGRIPGISKELDQKLGDCSYLVYLVHWQAGFVASMVVWGRPVQGISLRGIVMFIAAMIMCLVLSWIIVRFIERPMQRLRAKVKENACRRLNTSSRILAAKAVSYREPGGSAWPRGAHWPGWC